MGFGKTVLAMAFAACVILIIMVVIDLCAFSKAASKAGQQPPAKPNQTAPGKSDWQNTGVVPSPAGGTLTVTKN